MRGNLLRTLLVAGVCSLVPLSVRAYGQQPGAGQAGGTPATQPGPQTSPQANGPMSPDAQSSTMSTPAKVDSKKFLKEAAEGGIAEVELGKIAEQKASSPAVKQFAERMITDHTKANDQLKQLASKENVTVPAEAGSKEQSRIDKLSKLSGPEFDKAYIKDQIKDHKGDVSKFQSEAQGGDNPAVKEFAAQTLPTLQQHLALAKNLQKSGEAANAGGTQ